MKQNEVNRTEEDEMKLIRRAVGGDQEAFHRLVGRYEQGLRAYLTKMLGDWDAAQDVLQETFIALFQALPTWHPPVAAEGTAQAALQKGLLYPWLYHTATNRAISCLRKQTVRGRVQVQPGVERSTEQHRGQELQVIASQPSPEEAYIAREFLNEVLCKVKEDDALCLVLHYVYKERYEEIAQRLGLAKDTVRKRVNRALVTLRTVYQHLDMGVQR